jgi:hypothetical protein
VDIGGGTPPARGRFPGRLQAVGSGDDHIPTALFDNLADPGSAPASSTAAGVANAMAASLLMMALERTKPAPFGTVAQARALRRRAEGRIAQATISYERARAAIASSGPITEPVSGTLPVLEGICADAADVIALAEEVMRAVDTAVRADIAAAAQLAAGAARAAQVMFLVNRVRTSTDDIPDSDTLSARADALARHLPEFR